MQLCWCAGPYNQRPANMDITMAHAAPEMILGMVGGYTGVTCKHLIDARAQDVFSLGCFAFQQLTGKALFSSKATDDEECAAELCTQHLLWVNCSNSLPLIDQSVASAWCACVCVCVCVCVCCPTAAHVGHVVLPALSDQC